MLYPGQQECHFRYCSVHLSTVAVCLSKNNDFEFENQDTNVSDVEFDYDEIFASLDTENSSYYDNVSKSGVGVTFSERVSAMKEWADKALEKVNEKDMQKENVLKKNGGAR